MNIPNNPSPSQYEHRAERPQMIERRENVLFAAEHFLRAAKENAYNNLIDRTDQPLASVTDINAYHDEKVTTTVPANANDSLDSIRRAIEEAHSIQMEDKPDAS